MLTKYNRIFPDFTDHSVLHTLEILDKCNRFAGDQVMQLNADELYVLTMAALFHDVGMGLSEKHTREFASQIGKEQSYLDDPGHMREFTRVSHNELSGWFVSKYWGLFDIPNEKYAHAIIQLCRGHRKVDLFDSQEYPVKYYVSENNAVCLLYLSALIRLADETDITAHRNLAFVRGLPDKDLFSESYFEHRKHRCIKSLDIIDDKIIITAVAEDQEIYDAIIRTANKLDDTLKYCHKVVEKTPFKIYQDKVVLDIKMKQP